MCRTFLADESGATAVEYALLLAFIVLTIMGGVAHLGAIEEELHMSNHEAIETALTSTDR